MAATDDQIVVALQVVAELRQISETLARLEDLIQRIALVVGVTPRGSA
jgi:hypothetical protein